MAAVTKELIDSYIATFNSSITSGDMNAAEDALLQAEACLQSIPDTDAMRFHGSLKDLREMLEERKARSSTNRPRRMLARRNRG
jgi:hypothetical protein